MKKRIYIAPEVTVEILDNDYEFLAGSPVDTDTAADDSGENIQTPPEEVTPGDGTNAAAKKNCFFSFDEEW